MNYLFEMKIKFEGSNLRR